MKVNEKRKHKQIEICWNILGLQPRQECDGGHEQDSGGRRDRQANFCQTYRRPGKTIFTRLTIYWLNTSLFYD
jgi:hypothetical protein